MEIIESKDEVCRFYREHTGIDITAYGHTINRIFEELYYRKAPLTYARLLQKMEDIGIKPSYGAIDRARFEALCAKVQPEPDFLNAAGARFWYQTQPRMFSQEEISFMMSYDEETTLKRYPNLRATGSTDAPGTRAQRREARNRRLPCRCGLSRKP